MAHLICCPYNLETDITSSVMQNNNIIYVFLPGNRNQYLAVLRPPVHCKVISGTEDRFHLKGKTTSKNNDSTRTHLQNTCAHVQVL